MQKVSCSKQVGLLEESCKMTVCRHLAGGSGAACQSPVRSGLLEALSPVNRCRCSGGGVAKLPPCIYDDTVPPDCLISTSFAVKCTP